MKERPILFSGEMVRAILDGRKTMTRRVIKPLPPPDTIWDSISRLFIVSRSCLGLIRCCPYGSPGDRLWVREVWRPWSWHEGEPLVLEYGDQTQREVWYPEDADWLRFVEWEDRVLESLEVECQRLQIPRDAESGEYTWGDGPNPLRWRPSIHMPRWASRINLELTEVRVERLQEISEEEVWAEGIQVPASEGGGVLWRLAPSNAAGNVPASYLTPGRLHPDQPPVTTDEVARSHFADLWDTLNAKRDHPWESNPWVWVITFQTIGQRKKDS